MMLNEDVRELVPPIGLTKKIMSFVPKVSSADTVHMPNHGCVCRTSRDLINHSKISLKVWMCTPSHVFYKTKGSHLSTVKHLKVCLFKC